jgi:hypothetical protein
MQNEGACRPIRLGELDREMARMAPPANVAALVKREGKAGKDGDAVIALLAGHGDMGKAERAKLDPRELAFDALDLLQAKNVRLLAPDQAAHEIEPEPHRIDIPGGEPEAHGNGSLSPERRAGEMT